MHKIGLYYPYVHFRNDDWLKVAALYWPSMARLAAKESPKRDTAVARELTEKLNFCVDLDPARAAAAVGVIFVDLVREYGNWLRTAFVVKDADLVVSEEEKEQHERIQYDHYWEPLALSTPLRPPKFSAGTPLTPQGHDGGRSGDHPRRLAGLHREHLAVELADALQEESLAITAGRHNEWLGVAPELAWIYMCALTEEAARQTKLVPTTDQIGAHTASDLWHPDYLATALLGEPDSSTAAAAAMDAQMVALTAVHLVVPANISSVPVSAIVKLRNDYSDDFDAFLDLVASVADDLRSSGLAEVRDPVMFRRYLDNEVSRKLTLPFVNLKKALKGSRMDSAWSAFNMKAEWPELITSSAVGGLISQTPIVAAGGGLAFWLVSAWRKAHVDRAKVMRGPAAYLLRLEKGLVPQSLAGQVGHSVHKLAWLKSRRRSP